MKKSLVISTIATVLVVVVALTTATFAWFSTSSVSKTTSEFQVASTDNAITIQRWLPADSGNNGAYENPLTAPWTIGDGSAPNYEYPLTGTASVKGEGATASSAYSLLAPKAQLGMTYNTATENYGLPGVYFFSATQDGSVITDVQDNLRPVAVRFAISANAFEKTKAVASVTVSVNADATPADFNAAQNARVYLECVPQGGASQDSQAIKVATTYKYVTNPKDAYATTQGEDKIISTEGDAVQSGAESAQIAEGTTLVLDTTNTALVANVDTSVIKGEVTTSATSVVFSMEQGKMYDCVLYIWIDGLTANDTAASGAFSVAVEFSGVDATPAP